MHTALAVALRSFGLSLHAGAQLVVGDVRASRAAVGSNFRGRISTPITRKLFIWSPRRSVSSPENEVTVLGTLVVTVRLVCE